MALFSCMLPILNIYKINFFDNVKIGIETNREK